MIVVDVNVLAYLLIPGKFTEAAEQLLAEDSAWVVPRLWRSELRNILATYLRPAYDCEYVALAEFLDLVLVTADNKLAKAFPLRTRLLADG